jgi:hypothetical protein
MVIRMRGLRIPALCEPEGPRSRTATISRASADRPADRAARPCPATAASQRQNESTHVNQHPLENMFRPASARDACHPSHRRAQSCAPAIPAPPQQFFSMLAANPPPIAVHRWLRLQSFLPIPPPTLRLGDVSPHFRFLSSCSTCRHRPDGN